MSNGKDNVKPRPECVENTTYAAGIENSVAEQIEEPPRPQLSIKSNDEEILREVVCIQLEEHFCEKLYLAVISVSINRANFLKLPNYSNSLLLKI